MAKRRKRKVAKKPSRKAKKKDMFPFIFIAVGIIIIVLLTFLSKQPPEEPPKEVISQRDNYTFDEVWEDTQALDKDYVTEWKKEQLGIYMVPIPLIEKYVADLEMMKDWMNSSQYDEMSMLFVDARIAMLRSQKSFQKALAFGSVGVVNIRSKCDDLPYLKNATEYFNQSFKQGHIFTRNLDKVLAQAAKRPDIRGWIGVNTKKPRFYFSSFGDIWKVISSNTIAIEACEEGKAIPSEEKV